ncbi:MAG TPA: cation:proton antiporter, partial [Planctomycetota bacterium]|nr:cation:proton antiporter [Planctomycetota bacterium]
NVLSWVRSVDEVALLAELGAALLLFSVGLEYSWARLKTLGRVTLVGGSGQVLLTSGLVALGGWAMGLGWPAAIIVGCMVSLSSTASALKELEDRGLLESVHGGYSIGVLLIQDLAVIPFVLVATTLAQGTSDGSVLLSLAQSTGYALAAVAGLYVLFLHVVPRFLGLVPMTSNRDLSVLTAILAGLIAVIVAHKAGLSPALGAFIAGMLLAGSPFAVQVRADLSGLRTLFVTIFFSSIGAFGNPAWMLEHWAAVAGAAGGIVVLKSLATSVALRVAGARGASALATGIGLAQVGEFSFVIAAICRGTVLSEYLFLLLISAAILSMLLTPALIALAPTLATRLLPSRAGVEPEQAGTSEHPHPDVIVIGFGPAGRVVGDQMREAGHAVCVLDLNPRIVANARRFGFEAMVGDGLHQDVLRHAGLRHARVLVVAIPTPAVAVQVVRLVRAIAPQVVLVVRSRFHRHSKEIAAAGAHFVIDEETDIGFGLAKSVGEVLRPAVPESADTGGHTDTE